MSERSKLKSKKRIVVKVGSSTLTHKNTGKINLLKMEKLVRVLTDLHNSGKEVILVSSGAIAAGRDLLGLKKKPKETSEKQACAAVGQARLMTIYQKLFNEYHKNTAQVLMTKYTVDDETSKRNAINTFAELLKFDVIPVVNENDTVATDEIDFGDNDSLSAIVASLTGADLLVLLSDIDGLYTDNPKENPDAKLISEVTELSDSVMSMGKGAGSDVGTGGMAAKLKAAGIAAAAGIDMVIINGENVNTLYDVIEGKNVGTLFHAGQKG